jgi:hypothetical protein
VIALSAALATVATTTALAFSSDGVEGTSTRTTYVVGGEVVHHPLRTHARAAGRAPASTEASAARSTRYGYVVGGALVEPVR